MSELKICVYAISKNEEQFINRFYESAKNADMILLADTGSTDRTVEIAKELGITVYNVSVNPWRFDIARNTALSLVPSDYDVCFSLDLDEELTPGWREEIERLWVKGKTTIMHYTEEVLPGNARYTKEKIHARSAYSWNNICHEVLALDPRVEFSSVATDKVLVLHQPDCAKSRTFYVDLLRADTMRNPNESRMVLFLARELFHVGRLEEAVTEFDRFLNMPGNPVDEDKSYAYRTVAMALDRLGLLDEAIKAARKATHEAPHHREPWMDLAELSLKYGFFSEAFYAATTGLSITKRNEWYSTDPMAYSYKLYDQAAVAAWNLGMNERAVEYGEKAIEVAPEAEHLRENMKYYKGEK